MVVDCKWTRRLFNLQLLKGALYEAEFSLALDETRTPNKAVASLEVAELHSESTLFKNIRGRDFVRSGELKTFRLLVDLTSVREPKVEIRVYTSGKVKFRVGQIKFHKFSGSGLKPHSR